MRSLQDFPRILFYAKPVDFRKRRLSLSALIQDLGEQPYSQTLYLFMNRSRRVIRAIYWDSTGFALWEKGLEEARFAWPRDLEIDRVVLTHEQVNWLLQGIDLWKLKPHKNLSYSVVF